MTAPATRRAVVVDLPEARYYCPDATITEENGVLVSVSPAPGESWQVVPRG